jgi:hypothetical protein
MCETREIKEEEKEEMMVRVLQAWVWLKEEERERWFGFIGKKKEQKEEVRKCAWVRRRGIRTRKEEEEKISGTLVPLWVVGRRWSNLLMWKQKLMS